AIAALGKHRPTTVITQNIDGLHQEAGNQRVMEIHGRLLQIVNLQGHLMRRLARTDLRNMVEQLESVRSGMTTSYHLAGLLQPWIRLTSPMERPRIVLFGEEMAEPDWAEACQEVDRCDVMLVVGTSGLVYPAATLPVRARRAGAS